MTDTVSSVCSADLRRCWRQTTRQVDSQSFHTTANTDFCGGWRGPRRSGPAHCRCVYLWRDYYTALQGTALPQTDENQFLGDKQRPKIDGKKGEKQKLNQLQTQTKNQRGAETTTERHKETEPAQNDDSSHTSIINQPVWYRTTTGDNTARKPIHTVAGTLSLNEEEEDLHHVCARWSCLIICLCGQWKILPVSAVCALPCSSL